MKRRYLPFLVVGFAMAFVLFILAPVHAAAAPLLDDTPTFTSTPTATATPTATPTYTGGIIWAESSVSLSYALKDAISSVLSATPPTGHDGNIYAAVDATAPGDGHWLISVANLAGISAPYTDWDVMDDSAWMGSMDCTGTEPTWTCEYYDPEIPDALKSADEGLFLFPWQPGTSAIYGVAGVHETECGGCLLTGSSAVDFFGADSYGPNSMPPTAYAPASGIIVATCPGSVNMGIKVHGDSQDYVIFHLTPNPELTVGTTVQQGNEIGPLAYGNFQESNGCGHATQGANQYHIHFTFIPDAGYLQIGGCVLDIATQAFVCGTETIHPLGTLHNGGDTPPPCEGSDCQPLGLGGEHIWNGLITAYMNFTDALVKKFFPGHTAFGFADAFDRFLTVYTDFAWLIAASQIITLFPAIMCGGIVVTIEIVRWVFRIWKLIEGIITPV
jgi:hypothetical protein